MNAHAKPPRPSALTRNPTLERRLTNALRGEAKFDAFTRGRYATDASIYQIMPMGVVFPRWAEDIAATLQIAREDGVAVMMRGGGTSQNGQPIGNGIVVDCSRHFNALRDYSLEFNQVTVEPGMVLETLNSRLRREGLFFPVEPSTASRCTIGGMTGNNSCGARSLVFGKMVDNVLGVEALLANGDALRFAADAPSSLSEDMLALAEANRDEILARYPAVQRRVGGYNLDSLIAPNANPAHLLVGSEGTLAAFTSITLKLARLPAKRALGVCHFPSFRAAMETTQHLVALGPAAVELVDSNVLTLGADIPLFVKTLAKITRGKPDCLLLVEFAGESEGELTFALGRLDECMGDHGFPNSVVEVFDPATQKQVWEVREACLNIMMSMKGDAKPISFIEDCAVPLDRLADYTDAVSEVFERNGTRGTWYAHASVGCLHVRPILDMKTAEGASKMRAIAEEASALVRQFKGSYSGEHGDGISRSEFIAPHFGPKLVQAFETVKDRFDPENRLNPGKIVRPYRFDDRALMRFAPGYSTALPAKLDWSEWGGFGGAVEMCNNNGTCRKLSGGGMCPSYRATKDETHVTRGRANALRLAISGQLSAGSREDNASTIHDAFTSLEMAEAMSLCVGCKACKRECPTGVDMAKMKVEFLSHYKEKHGLTIRDRLVGWLPRYAPVASKMPTLMNLRNRVPLLAKLMERVIGFSALRPLPEWQKPFDEGEATLPVAVRGDGLDVLLYADPFNRYFEPENLEAARRVLTAAGYRVAVARVKGHPVNDGRTFLAIGQVDEARKEARRLIAAFAPFVARGARIIGLEPSCLLTIRDEFFALLPKAEVEPIAKAAFLFEEVLAADMAAGRVKLPLAMQNNRIAHLHGHCHQKAADVMKPVEAVLHAVPGLRVQLIESACCGMAGSFGYQAETHDVSLAMAELSLLPAVRAAGADDWIIADGTSCRHQIGDGAGREAMHVVRLLDQCLESGDSDA